jgi:hypothetical protein
MRAARLQDAPERLTAAIRDVESELVAMKAEHDPLASHIFVSRRHYRTVNDTKSGKRREMIARLSFNTACELGFRGSLDGMGAPDGSSCEAVNTSWAGAFAVRQSETRNDRILSDQTIIRQSDCMCSSIKPSFRTTLHRNARALFGCALG